jgi:galactonate dehydratase
MEKSSVCGRLDCVKITDVTTFVIKNPPPSFGGKYFIVVKLTTDTGIVGYGEIYAATFGPHLIAALVDDVAARWVIDQDPNRIELMWRRIYSSGYSLRPDPTLVGIMSGLEMACWDIVGKDAGKPIYDLLGGRVHEKLRTYTYLYPSAGYREVYTNPDHAAARAVNEVERGFTALKFDPAGPYTAFDGHMPSQDDVVASAQMMATLRGAVGPKADLLFGTHGQFTAAGAIRLARELEPFDPLWFEEPCAPDLPHEMARVAAHTSIPIATGERLTTISEFAALGRHQAAGIWQPNLNSGWQEDRSDRRGEWLPDRATPVFGSDPRRCERSARCDVAEPVDHRRDPRVGRLPRRPVEDPHPMGERLCHPLHGARPRCRVERGGRARQPVARHGRRPAPPVDGARPGPLIAAA